MKYKTLIKDFFMEIKKSPGRFFSILFIVALGVAFFTGIRTTELDMRYTIDNYYDKTNLSDVVALSSYGVTDDEIKSMSLIDSVKKVEGRYSKSFFSEYDDEQIVVKVDSILDTLNKPVVIEGRLPENYNECVIDSDFKKINIGDEIKLHLPNKENTDEYIKTDTFTVTGKVNSPEYMGFARGSTDMGTGVISGFIFVPPEAYNMDVYSAAYIQVDGAEEKTVFTKPYDEVIDKAIHEIENATSHLSTSRLQDIKKEANEKIDKQLKKGLDAINEGKDELMSGQREIDKNKNTLEKSRKELNQGLTKYNDGVKAWENGNKKYQSGKKTYDKQVKQYNKNEKSLNKLKTELDKLKVQYDQIKDIPGQEAAAARLKAAIDKMEPQYTKGKAGLKTYKKQLGKADKTLINSKKKLDSSKKQLEVSKTKLDQGKKELNDGEKKLAEAQDELLDGQREIGEKTDELNERIAEARADVEELKSPKWYINDRGFYPDNDQYGDNAVRIGSIGTVFPVIFFLVAALVCLTAMTRFVEEQRLELGTLKALGYSKFVIGMKYISYALLATLGGSIIGVLIGEKLFPVIIINAYKMMYDTLPAPVVPYDLKMSLTALGLAVLSTLAATILVIINEMKESPASLMRPPSPKRGNRILLERARSLWSHINFTWKSTLRNLFRYKKRLFMTILGIAACMALMVTGYGIKDSIYNVTNIQYNQIQTYQATVYFDEDSTSNEVNHIREYAKNDSEVSRSMTTNIKNHTIKNGNKDWDAYIFVPEDIDRIGEFINCRDRITHEKYKMDENSVFITEKLAKELDVKVGDVITVDDKTKKLKITAIVENYLGHYVYMSPDVWEDVFIDPIEYNSLIFNTIYDDDNKIERVGEKLLGLEGALNVQYNADLQKQMDDMIKTMSEVIIVLIVSAALLAFVVLYNLNIINISERRRELATLKVLGFYDMEVAKYVLRENVILTAIGIVGGIVMGFFLHQYIIQTVEIEGVMFGRVINFVSYVLSAALTAGFAVLVNIVMYFSLKKIDMVESLKSVE